MKKCLIISYGPTPTPKYQKIEGGGQRCWGLATGLKKNGYEVTVAINNSFPLDVENVEGVTLVNWSEDQTFGELLNTYDVVIMNYAMGGPMSYVVDHISDNVTLVLDCYVPIYIEVSARNSDDKVTEYSNYSHDILHYNKALKRGDYFLCANIPQKHMYIGALSALGIINPYSYEKERVLLVPFGVEENLQSFKKNNPYKKLGVEDKDFTLLWFGGLYPWFNIKPLLSTIEKISLENKKFKFVIVGGKNPYNSNPDFIKQYELTYSHFKKAGLLDTIVHFVDWVDFSERLNWYQNADMVISINNVGEENVYSWRTRVMDYVWGEIPMLTNGGDPLSDSLIAAGAAIKLDDTSESELYNKISQTIQNKSSLKKAKENLLLQKDKYYWNKVVAPLVTQLDKDQQPYLEEKIFIASNVPDTVEEIQSTGVTSKLKKLARMPRKAIRMAKNKGIKRTVKIVARALVNRIDKSVRPNQKRYYFFSHPIDYTGAPMVLLDIISDFAKKVSTRAINVLYPGGEAPLLNRLFKMGIKTEKMVMGIGSRILQAQLHIQPDDFVLMNTVAIYPNYRDFILGLLDSGKLNRATWFIHEDIPKLRFDDQGLIRRVERLVNEGKLQIVVPSQQTANDYNSFFNTNSVKVITLRVDVPEKYTKPRQAKSYSNKLSFVISGTPSDGRKGQLLAISAFAKFKSEFYDKDPTKYREFELHLIAIGEKGDDYISTQIRAIGDGLLGGRIRYYPRVSKDVAHEITHKCNATVCCSLNETFGLFVAEGMMMGHLILRNATSGVHEQLVDGENGLLIDELDTNSFAKSIESLLNKKTSNKKLRDMGISSQKISSKFRLSDYTEQL